MGAVGVLARPGGQAWPRWLATLVALTAVAGAARLLGLERQSFWYDEAVAVELARSPLSQILAGQAKDLGNPPFYPALLHLWLRLFGDGDAAARALSALLGTLTVPLLYRIGRRILPEGAALAGTALYALSPYQLQLGQEARSYALLTFLGVAAVAALLWALDSPRRWLPWLLFAAATAGAALTHYFGLFLAVALALYLALAHRRDPPVLARATIAFGLAAAGFCLWLPALLEQLAVQGNLTRSADSWHRHLLATPLVFAVGPTLVWKDSATVGRLLAGLIAGATWAALCAIGVWRTPGRAGRGLLLSWLLVPVAIPALLSVLAGPVYNSRYVILASIPFYLFAGAGLAALPVRPGLAAAGVLAASMIVSQATYLTRPIKHQWREAAAALESALRPGDALLFEVDHNETAYAHYARHPSLRLRLREPPPGSRPDRLYAAPAAGAPTLDVTETVRAHRRVWLVLSDATPAGRERAQRLLRDRIARPALELRGIRIQLLEAADR